MWSRPSLNDSFFIIANYRWRQSAVSGAVFPLEYPIPDTWLLTCHVILFHWKHGNFKRQQQDRLQTASFSPALDQEPWATAEKEWSKCGHEEPGTSGLTTLNRANVKSRSRMDEASASKMTLMCLEQNCLKINKESSHFLGSPLKNTYLIAWWVLEWCFLSAGKEMISSRTPSVPHLEPHSCVGPALPTEACAHRLGVQEPHQRLRLLRKKGM